MVTTIILGILIALACVFGLRNFVKGKGSCGDCDCTCPIKEEMRKASKVE
ncbi:FeoB-associated Cys-rich membrane protein [Streptococcus merionis]|nr:FeoB-associated Cys-rich membrane protein [Streptococcus merionis]